MFTLVQRLIKFKKVNKKVQNIKYKIIEKLYLGLKLQLLLISGLFLHTNCLKHYLLITMLSTVLLV